MRFLQLRQFLRWILFSFELFSHSKSFYIILYMKNWILKFVTFSTDFYFFIIILLNVNIMHTLYAYLV